MDAHTDCGTSVRVGCIFTLRVADYLGNMQDSNFATKHKPQTGLSNFATSNDLKNFQCDAFKMRFSYSCAEITLIIILGPDLQNILRQSYNRRIIYKTSYEGHRLFLGTIHLHNHRIVWDSNCKLAYDIPKRNVSML